MCQEGRFDLFRGHWPQWGGVRRHGERSMELGTLVRYHDTLEYWCLMVYLMVYWDIVLVGYHCIISGISGIMVYLMRC